jgi:hypothetical protein
MTTERYCAADNPPDLQAAALVHLVRAPEALTGMRFRGPLQDLAAILDVEGAPAECKQGILTASPQRHSPATIAPT